MNKLIKKIVAPLALGVAALTSTNAMAELPKLTFCVFDIVGKQGDVYSMMEDYRLEAMKWGVDFNLKAYTDEKIASEDFKADKCDAVGMTGMRGRSFNPFTGTIDSIGSIPTYDHLKVVMQYLSSPKLADKMRNGEYEVAGIAPAGAAYLFTNDRSIDTVGELSGKKIAVLEFDKSQAIMVESIGASPVSASIATFGPMFNNGSVDVIAAPALAYGALELYKGLGEKGAIVNFALAQLTVQIMIRHEKFPEGFGQSSREYLYSQYDRAMELIVKGTGEIKSNYWLELPEKDKVGYQEMFRQTRLSLREKGIYDPKMLSFLSKIRCKMDSALAECSAADRE